MRLYPSADEPVIWCQTCGSKYRRARTACPRCGANRVEASDPESAIESAAPRAARARLWAGAAASIVAAAALAWPIVVRHEASATRTVSAAGVLETGGSDPRSRRSFADDGATERSTATAFLDDKASGRLAYREERFDDALDHFNAALASNPNDQQALNGAGQVLVRTGRAGEALRLLERAAELAPSDWETLFNLARAYGEAGEWREAVATYERAAAARPGHYPTLFNLARSLERNGQVEQATAAYREAARAPGADPSVHLALAVTCERAEDWPSAKAAYVTYLASLTDEAEAARVRERLVWLNQREGGGPRAGTP